MPGHSEFRTRTPFRGLIGGKIRKDLSDLQFCMRASREKTLDLFVSCAVTANVGNSIIEFLFPELISNIMTVLRCSSFLNVRSTFFRLSFLSLLLAFLPTKYSQVPLKCLASLVRFPCFDIQESS